ncbi:MAG: hypothetical protein AAF198_11370 [Pseudomonadota bacterium]
MRAVRFIILALTLILSAKVVIAQSGEVNQTSYIDGLNFVGAAFTVEIPDGFSIRPSLPSTSQDGKFDSVIFDRADGQVSFYIYSPEFSGWPQDIMMNPSEESILSETGDESGGYVHTWWTIQSLSGDHLRTYHSRSHLNGGEVVIIGFERSANVPIDDFRDDYIRFKSSFSRLSPAVN